MKKKTLADLTSGALQGRTVLVRLDLNVPMSESGEVQDDTRLLATRPTLDRLLDAGARVVILSHFGRPQGSPNAAFSLAPVAAALGVRLGRPMNFSAQSTGDVARAAVEALRPGEAVVLENTRFHPGETTNDMGLAREWAALGDLFVNDAFGAAHRAHASTEALAQAVRAAGGEAVAGYLMQRELEFLGRALEDPERPFVAILGGAKISGKIDVVEALLDRVDRLIIGGAMANTFFLALGLEMGKSLVEEDRVEMAHDVLARGGTRVLLPVDVRVASEIGPTATTRAVSRDAVTPSDRVGDIGPQSEALFREAIMDARTLLWNGPMGVFEMPPFAGGTIALAEAVADAADAGATAIVGGGDSAAAAEAAGVTERMTHVSTGGGAALEFLSGAPLPGVSALSEGETR